MSLVIQPTNKPADRQRRGTTTATLTIPSRTGHRRTLTDYFVKAGASSFSDISLGNVIYNRIYDNLAQAILVKDLETQVRGKGLLSYLKSLIPDLPYPTVTQDEALTIARNAAPTRIDAYFEDADQGDVVSRVVPGGSLATKQLLIVNINNNSAVSASGSFNFDKVDMPTGLNPFQDSSDIVTNGRRITKSKRLTLYAIAGNFPKATDSKVTRVHVNDERIELFASENQEGLFVDPDNGNELAFDLPTQKVFWLPTPYVMESERLFTFTGEATHDGTNNLPANSLKLFLICMSELIGAS